MSSGSRWDRTGGSRSAPPWQVPGHPEGFAIGDLAEIPADAAPAETLA